ncbi:MAG TPA: bifunctional demethylmenaquinone methyltransferase/2-methoxy-6-polyprenyl-1,4-benzoquinol methylase UbiE [Planctomycetota bacterium]|nr:bifunctional demethylmenaquinone methyltransferase/2-methoxy-6-polyprenyl-1,4-benzoquinol methylase UbiE [Planctomycetota bacterium]
METISMAVDKSPRKIREMFDLISPRYDFLNHLLSLNVDVLWRRKAAEKCGPHPKRVLDVCSGTGDLALELRRRWNCDVTATDFAYQMLRRARAKGRKDAGVRFQQADTVRLPFRDGAFDACAVAFGLRNVADTNAGIREMVRVVKPGGRVVILEFTTPPSRLLRSGYRFYFSRVLPAIGELIAPARRGAYRYLPESVESWPTPDELTRALQRAGLKSAGYERLTFGIAAVHFGTKPDVTIR